MIYIWQMRVFVLLACMVALVASQAPPHPGFHNVQINSPEQAVEALRNTIPNPRDMDAVKWALRGTLRQIAPNTDRRLQFVRAGGAEMLITVMRMHINDASVAEWGGQATVLLTMDGISEHSSRFKQAVDVICRLLQRHARRNRQTAFWLFQAVANVAANGKQISESFQQSGIVNVLTDVLSVYHSDTEVLKTACRAVEELAKHNADKLFDELLLPQTQFLQHMKSSRENTDLSKETIAVVDQVMAQIKQYRTRHGHYWALHDEFADTKPADSPTEGQHLKSDAVITVERLHDLPSSHERMSRDSATERRTHQEL